MATASQENPTWNAAYNNPATYTSSNGNGAPGTFKENGGSGSLEFTDADLNTIWAINPKQTISPNATVKLFFTAKFNNSVLNIPDGTSLRAEVVVTFGNAGARGGSGASGSNIDIDGSGTWSSDETNVRSVPTRITRNLPALTICNDSVSFNDTFDTTGTAAYTAPVWNPFLDPNLDLPKSISATTSWTITTTLSGDGTVTNTATLTGTGTTVNVIIGTDPQTLLPIYQSFPCCVGTDLEAHETIVVGNATPPPALCTETHFENNSPDAQYEFSFYLKPGVFPSGFVIGNYDTISGNSAPNGFKWTIDTTGQDALKDFITGGGGTSSALTKDLLNPTSGSGGSLARHTVTLYLNVKFGGVIVAGGNSVPDWPAGFNDLTLTGTGGSLDGSTVDTILAAAQAALADGTLPSGYSFSDLESLLDKLNKSFNGCKASAWAAGHLQ